MHLTTEWLYYGMEYDRHFVWHGQERRKNVFLTNGNISWGQQVAVMFQIISTLMEAVPVFALRMMELRGEQPRMQFVNDPWGHDEKCVEECDCLVSDRTGAFVHCLIPPPDQTSLTPGDNTDDSEKMSAGFTFRDDCGYLGIGHAGETGRVWPVVVGGVCTMEVWITNIF